MIKIGPLHLITGLAAFGIFLVSGFYMYSGFPELYGNNEAIHYMYRANHVDRG